MNNKIKGNCSRRSLAEASGWQLLCGLVGGKKWRFDKM